MSDAKVLDAVEVDTIFPPRKMLPAIERAEPGEVVPIPTLPVVVKEYPLPSAPRLVRPLTPTPPVTTSVPWVVSVETMLAGRDTCPVAYVNVSAEPAIL